MATRAGTTRKPGRVYVRRAEPIIYVSGRKGALIRVEDVDGRARLTVHVVPATAGGRPSRLRGPVTHTVRVELEITREFAAQWTDEQIDALVARFAAARYGLAGDGAIDAAPLAEPLAPDVLAAFLGAPVGRRVR